MQVRVSGRHIAVTESVKQYCDEKAAHMVHFFDRIREIEFVLDGHDGHHFAEVIVHADGTPPFVASEEHTDLHAAVDQLTDKIERQLRRHKDRVRNRKHS